jgi:hypothetical protein
VKFFKDDDEPQHRIGSVEKLRDFALICFDKFLAERDGRPPISGIEETCQEYLSVGEVETILKENSQCNANGFYGVGGDTAEEANKNMETLMTALMQRILSNVISGGVRDGWLDCAFDTEQNDFCFKITDKGREIVEQSGYNSEFNE